MLLNVAKRVLVGEGSRKDNVNKSNAHNAVLFEVIVFLSSRTSSSPRFELAPRSPSPSSGERRVISTPLLISFSRFSSVPCAS